MRFFSDNAAPVHPAVFAAMAAADTLDTAYDGDAWSRQLDGRFSDLFETPVKALWVPSGTAANCLALAALCPPHGAVACHRDAHIQNDECGAPEFYTHGAKLLLAEGEGAKLTVETISTVLDATRNDVHQVQPHAISITNATEYGRVYTPDEVAAIGALARARGLGLHMDGARLANALVHLGCTPAEGTWKAGVDVLAFGGTKNGALAAEAVIFFEPGKAAAFERRRKRAGQLWSKMRYLSAQLLALLEDGLWLRHARNANGLATQLAAGLVRQGLQLAQPVQANEVFAHFPAELSASLRARGFEFYDWPGPPEATVPLVRLVTRYDQRAEQVDALLAAIRGA